MCSMQTLPDLAGKQRAAMPPLGEGQGAKLVRMMDGDEIRLVAAAMVALGPVQLRDVDDAQAGIVAVAKHLADQGVIEISEGNNDEMVQ